MSSLAFDNTQWLITPEGETADALGFSVGSWTKLYNLPGRTGFTAHFILVPKQINALPIGKAVFEMVYQSSDNSVPSARIVAVSYSGGQPFWETDWGVFHRDGNNPTNQTIDVTAKLLALLATGRDNPQIGLEVNGTGVLQQAKLVITYEIPDLRAALTALTAEVVSLTALVGRTAVLEAAKADLYSRVEALEAALAAALDRLGTLEAPPPPPAAPVPIILQIPAGGISISLGGQ